MKEKLLISVDMSSMLVSNAELRREESGYFKIKSSEYKTEVSLVHPHHRQAAGGWVNYIKLHKPRAKTELKSSNCY